MNKNVYLLDCTLRDGAYINDGKFGAEAIKSIITNLESAGVNLIECGWLKNDEHLCGSSYFHCSNDLSKYIIKKNNIKYCLMIDWNRYDLKFLEKNDGNSCDIIRVTFPIEHINDGIKVGEEILKKGYEVSFQLINAKSYCKKDDMTLQIINDLIKKINDLKVKSVSIADTFGSMFADDIKYITDIFDEKLSENIMLGLHTHNNMQLAFSNTITFIDCMNIDRKSKRNIVVDSSIYGMGRGAGNTTTELLMNYLNKFYLKEYNISYIYKIIDEYIYGFKKKYDWGYIPEYGLAGINCSHINNINYLMTKYKISTLDLKMLLEELDENNKTKYYYDFLDDKYICMFNKNK